MKRSYFVSVEYWNSNKNFNKFASGIIEMDIQEEQMIEVIKDFLSNTDPVEYTEEGTTVKVLAFNNIE